MGCSYYLLILSSCRQLLLMTCEAPFRLCREREVSAQHIARMYYGNSILFYQIQTLSYHFAVRKNEISFFDHNQSTVCCKKDMATGTGWTPEETMACCHA